MGKIGEGSEGVVFVVERGKQKGAEEAAEAEGAEGAGEAEGADGPSRGGGNGGGSSGGEAGGRASRYAIKAYKPASSSSRRGVCTAAIREICLLRELQHPNVIQLNDVHIAQKERAVFLSYEYVSHDLQQVIRHFAQRREKIPAYTVKSLLWQVLRGLEYLHANWVMHRDLKPSNILITADPTPPRSGQAQGQGQGQAKIADFGLARVFKHSLQPLRANGTVVTLWYRAPELLLGARHYSPAIDMWALGCLFGELLRLKPLFYSDQLPGNAFQVRQMERIINVLGRPQPSRWPQLQQMEHWQRNAGNIQEYRPPKGKARRLEAMLALEKDDPALVLVRKMLEYDPAKRLTAAEALRDPYFRTEPFPGTNCFSDAILGAIGQGLGGEGGSGGAGGGDAGAHLPLLLKDRSLSKKRRRKVDVLQQTQ